MYKCQKCNKTTTPHEKCNKVVVETRDKEYINEYENKWGNKKQKITNGYEIAKEINVCDECYSKMKGEKNGE